MYKIKSKNLQKKKKQRKEEYFKICPFFTGDKNLIHTL